jgi:Domain of unknown function (DUF4260)
VGNVVSVEGAPRLVLRSEGLALWAVATAAFAFTGLSWWFYAVLFLAPDVSFAAYGAGPRIGAAVYNALRTTVAPAALAAVGWLAGSPLLLGIAAIWAAHVGFDRALGYGLKYGTGFGHTHLGPIGRSRSAA